MSFKTENAHTVALKGIHYILDNDDRQNEFFQVSGVSPGDFKASIEDPEFLGGVLDFLLNDEKQLILFCQIYEIEPTEPANARRCFPGGNYDY